MVGDSLTSDIKGGIDYGLDTCWFNADQRQPESDVKPTYEIRRLAELCELLDR
jgi:2-haloacid dehalogenase